MTYPPQGGYPDQQYPSYPPVQPSYPPAGQEYAAPGYPTSGQPGYGPSYPPAGPASAPPGYAATGQPGYGPSYPPMPQQPGPAQYGQNPYQNPYPYQQNPYGGYPAGPRTRPGAVTIAAVLMMALPVLSIINYMVSIAATSTMRDNLRQMFVDAGVSQSTVDASLSNMSISNTFSGVTALIGAVIIGLLAVFNLRGVNGTRIATWVLLGLSIAGNLCGALSIGAVQSQFDSLSSLSQETFNFDDILPSWYYAWAYLNVIVSLAIDITVIVLLARPVSNAFFRGR